MKKTSHTQSHVRELQDALAKNAPALPPQSKKPADSEQPVQPDQIHNSGGGYRSDLEVVDPDGV